MPAWLWLVVGWGIIGVGTLIWGLWTLHRALRDSRPPRMGPHLWRHSLNGTVEP